MLPFRVALESGEAPHKQIVYAATRAVLSGELALGASFPSVRELSLQLKINPNTAHKVVATLIREGLLEVRPGIGTVVSAAPIASASQKRRLLSREVEQLVVEAKKLGLAVNDVVHAVSARWEELFDETASRERRIPAARTTRKDRS